MKTGEKASRGSHAAHPIVRLLGDAPARSSRRGSPMARLCAATMRAATPLVDLLLDCFCLLVPADDSPGVPVSTSSGPGQVTSQRLHAGGNRG
jgi:hypothetical protein